MLRSDFVKSGRLLVEAMEAPTTLILGVREYWAGRIGPVEAVCLLSRIGKVAAATLVEKFGVAHILFTGLRSDARGFT